MLLDIYTRAREHQNLTAAERTLLRFIDGALLTALLTALNVIYQTVSQPSVHLKSVLLTALSAGGVSLGLSISKFLRASGELPLADSVQEGTDLVAQRAGVNEAHIPIFEPVQTENQ